MLKSSQEAVDNRENMNKEELAAARKKEQKQIEGADGQLQYHILDPKGSQ